MYVSNISYLYIYLYIYIYTYIYIYILDTLYCVHLYLINIKLRRVPCPHTIKLVYNINCHNSPRDPGSGGGRCQHLRINQHKCVDIFEAKISCCVRKRNEREIVCTSHHQQRAESPRKRVAGAEVEPTEWTQRSREVDNYARAQGSRVEAVAETSRPRPGEARVCKQQ